MAGQLGAERNDRPHAAGAAPPRRGGGEKGGFYSFFTPNNRKYRWLAIDGNGTKWLGADFGLGDLNGLFYYNDRGTVADKSDDVWGNLKQDNGLPDNNVTSIKIDPDGLIWVGTTSGLTTLLNPMSVVINNQPPDFQSIKLLSNVRISAIAIDVLNRKWIGTSDQGVFLLSPDGTRLLEHYTTSNSPLVNNQIYSILAVDTTGDVYIGTANGMSRISTAAVESPVGGGQITVAPQPFRLPSGEPLRIAGLPGNATVKILTLTGGLVRQVPAPGGGVAFWDGTDERGEYAPSGVYIVAAESNDGGGTVVGKVAVIRQ
jgi:ligand-binding sensor domain-containing protein